MSSFCLPKQWATQATQKEESGQTQDSFNSGDSG